MPQASDIRPPFKAGDLLFFSGRGWLAAGLKFASADWLWAGFSHVGLIVEFWKIADSTAIHPSRRLLVVEATTLDRKPCEITGATSGCRARSIQPRIDSYDGRVYYFPLRTELLQNRCDDLEMAARGQLGRKYGYLDLLRCRAYRRIKLLPGSRRALHCSESSGDILKQTGIIECDDVSALSPNSLAGLVTDQGTHGPAWRCE